MPASADPSRVLVVDDDEVIAGAVFQYLLASGVCADLATTQIDAERLLRAHDYALVLMDAFLTGNLSERAVALVERVRSLSPNAQMIVLTAYGSKHLEKTFATHERLRIVAKPKPVSYIAEMIGGLLP